MLNFLLSPDLSSKICSLSTQHLNNLIWSLQL